MSRRARYRTRRASPLPWILLAIVVGAAIAYFAQAERGGSLSGVIEAVEDVSRMAELERRTGAVRDLWAEIDALGVTGEDINDAEALRYRHPEVWRRAMTNVMKKRGRSAQEQAALWEALEIRARIKKLRDEAGGIALSWRMEQGVLTDSQRRAFRAFKRAARVPTEEHPLDR